MFGLVILSEKHVEASQQSANTVTCGFEAEVLMGLAAVSRVSPDEVKEEEMLFTLKVPTISDVMLTRLDVKCHNSHTPTPLLSSQDIDISCSGSQINSIIYLKSQLQPSE